MTALVIFMIGIAALGGQVAWALARRQPEARKPMAAVIALAIVGYALTGHTLMADRPARPIPSDTTAVAAFSALRQQHLTMAGDTGAWLTFAEALEGNARTADAVATLREALVKDPKSPDLWIGLGTALVLHAGGAMTPAARMAYARGETLGARRPDLRRFRELACARAGTC